MESSESQDENHVLSSNSFKGSEANGNESVYYEKFLLDDLDNYWDELNDRLTVTRMVNDSVIKGIVNALLAESKENIALKEVQIETLDKKLNSLHNVSPLKHSVVEENSVCRSFGNISELRVDVEDHIQKLKENIHNADIGMGGTLPKEMKNAKLIEAHKSVNSLGTIVHTLFKEMDEMHEIQLQDKLEREINSTAFGSSVENLQNMFEKKLYEQISLNKRLNMDWQQKANELSGIRNHLNYLSSTLASAESKLLLSHNSLDSLDSFEEWNTPKRKELVSRKVSGSHRKEENDRISKNSKSDVPDASQLKHLSRDELVEYYKNEMISMRRQHESSLQKKTEEIFKLKRELDSFEEWNTLKRKELVSRKVSGSHRKEENGTISKNSKSDVPDASQLKHLSREELIEYYKNEMISMRRQHESALQEKTEEIFKLKREFLRQKGSSPFKNEHEILRKTIAEIIRKLDGIILEKDMMSVVQVNEEEVCILRNNVNKLQTENVNLKSVLGMENKVNGGLLSHSSDVASQMLLNLSPETEYLQRIKKLEEDVNTMEMENCIKDVVYGSIIKEIICESQCVECDLEAVNGIMQDVMNIVINGYTHDVMSSISSVISRHCTEKSHLEELLWDREERLRAEIEKNKMEEKIASSFIRTKDDEKHALQSEQLNQLIEEVKKLKEQLAKQEALISDKEIENDLLNNKINEALQQLHQYDSNFIKLNEELENVSNALDEAEKQKSLFQSIIEDDQKKLSSYIADEKRQANHSELVVKSIAVLLEASVNLEHKVVENIQRNEYRLKALHQQCMALVQQANVLPNKMMLYKEMYDIKSSNLQKAEAEVDLLGDEVDTLLTLLGKIYIALDHYSPVLKYYPGVMETLKLVRRELGEPEVSMNEKSSRLKKATKSLSKFR